MARVCLGNIKGPKGDSGPAGPAGPKGDTPVKGVDYLTEEDINAINGSTVESTDHPGCYYRMVNEEVEWINPPMMLGVEYRTTERYLSKPVYCKLVNINGCPGSGSKVVTYANEGTVAWVVSAQGQMEGYAFPSHVIGGSMSVDIETTKTNITVRASQDYMKDSPCYVLIKYTKV
jgi:hypothetical protein